MASNLGGDKPNPAGWIITWLSVVLAVAVTFVATPQLHGATADWALGYMEQNYGLWMVAIGWFFWWIIVALLTFLFSALMFMMTIMLGGFLIALLAGRFAR